MANIAALLPKLTARDCNDLVFGLKRFRHEKYKEVCYGDKSKLILVDFDDAVAAVRLWGPAALADKLDRLHREQRRLLGPNNRD
jgi:hypothetical protein